MADLQQWLFGHWNCRKYRNFLGGTVQDHMNIWMQQSRDSYSEKWSDGTISKNKYPLQGSQYHSASPILLDISIHPCKSSFGAMPHLCWGTIIWTVLDYIFKSHVHCVQLLHSFCTSGQALPDYPLSKNGAIDCGKKGRAHKFSLIWSEIWTQHTHQEVKKSRKKNRLKSKSTCIEQNQSTDRPMISLHVTDWVNKTQTTT